MFLLSYVTHIYMSDVTITIAFFMCSSLLLLLLLEKKMLLKFFLWMTLILISSDQIQGKVKYKFKVTIMLKHFNRNVTCPFIISTCLLYNHKGDCICRWYLYKMIAIKSSYISLAKILINLIICKRKVSIFGDNNRVFFGNMIKSCNWSLLKYQI